MDLFFKIMLHHPFKVHSNKAFFLHLMQHRFLKLCFYYVLFFFPFTCFALPSNGLLETLPSELLFSIGESLLKAKDPYGFFSLYNSSNAIYQLSEEQRRRPELTPLIWQAQRKKAHQKRRLFSLEQEHYCIINTHQAVQCHYPFLQPQTYDHRLLGSALMIKTHQDTSCIIQKKDHKLRCWKGTHHNEPSFIPDGLGPVTSVSIQDRAICVILQKDAHIHCWGHHYPFPLARTLKKTAGPITQMILYQQGGCAIRADDEKTICWNVISLANTAPQMTFMTSAFTTLSLNSNEGTHACAIDKKNGFAHCFSTLCINTFPSPFSLLPISAIETGVHYFCAIKKKNQTVTCWNSEEGPYTKPFPKDLGPVSDLKVYEKTACAIKAINQSVICWGNNQNKQANVPVDLGPVLAIDLHQSYVCALKNDHTFACWGTHFYPFSQRIFSHSPQSVSKRKKTTLQYWISKNPFFSIFP